MSIRRLSCCRSSSCNWEQMWRGRLFNWGCQAGGRVCWAPRDLLISLRFNSLWNKLCRLQFLRILVTMWTFCDFCLAFFPPPLTYFKVGKWSKTVEKNKIPNVGAPCVHKYSSCLSRHCILSLRKQKQATLCDVFFSPFFFLLEHSPVRRCNISIGFPFSHMCVFYFGT